MEKRDIETEALFQEYGIKGYSSGSVQEVPKESLSSQNLLS